jgi:hydroxyacylglutathione hydrolase
MPPEIKVIRLLLPFRLGSVNCYLLKNETGYLLIDTGGSNQRAELVKQLESAGCHPDRLNLIVLTHGDFDHSGNAAYLRDKFGAKIAMHAGDAGMLERGDMSWNRKKGRFLLGKVVPILFRFGESERCKPDIYLDEGDSLAEFGFDARLIALPGHSAGSIGVLASAGGPSDSAEQVLFCGDLLNNTRQPALNSIMDDPAAANASLQKLKSFAFSVAYPGHGQPFPASLLPHATSPIPTGKNKFNVR